MRRRICMGGGAALGFFAGIFAAAAARADEPSRLGDALGLPPAATLEGSYRVRYEHLDNPFRAGSTGSDQLLVERLLLGLRVDGERVYAGLELQDSRAQLGDARPPLGTDDVNALEPLRAYVGLGLDDAFAAGDRLNVAAGRITIDAGSRRLVARNRFRNTLNAFTGVNALWTGAGGSTLQLFYVLPVNRVPAAPARLDENEIELDEQSSDVRFWAAVASRKSLFGNVQGDLYVYGLNERDGRLPTADRAIYTPGARLLSRPAPGAWDFEIEAALQLGESRASLLPADTADLDHRAGFVHVHVGRSFDREWEPRLVLSYDYASGDRQPDDDENNRFDTLYGARRFDFGPTGIYGALARANVSSPGIGVEAAPAARTELSVNYRAAWLTSRRDALVTAGLRDPSGASGRFVGHQVEFQLAHEAVPGVLDLEIGGAWLVDGEFLEDAPGAPSNGDSFYWYGQVALAF